MKKLLSIILSAVILLTFITANVFAYGERVSDILPDDFPTATAGTVPENAWVNENGYKLYSTTSNIAIDNTEYFPISGPVTESGDNYVGTDTLFSRTFTFVMEEDTLVSIIAAGFTGEISCNNGTYRPADTKDVDIEYNLISGYEWSVPSGTQTITATEATIGNIEVTACVLEANKVLNITVASKNNFTVKSGDNSIAYSLATTSGGAALSNHDVLISTNTTASQALYAKITGTAAKAGTYTDTLTFTASIADAE